MIEIKQIRCGTDNCYLIISGGDAVLVDTSGAEGFDTVAAECDRYNMKLIVLTHVHFDHAENAAALSERYDIPVAYNRTDDALFEDFDAQPLISCGLVGKVVLGLSLKDLRGRKIRRPEKLIPIEEGYSLEGYGIDAKIISLPGHTHGSIGVLAGDDAVIVGDALDNWLWPAAGHLYTDKQELDESVKKIRSLGSRTIYYGHGKPTSNRT